MSATASSSAEAVLSASAGLAGVGAAPDSSLLASAAAVIEGSLPVAGQRWRETYDIIRKQNESSDTPEWLGRSVKTGKEVVLRAFRPTQPALRAAVWSKLAGIDSPHLQRAHEAHVIDDWRVEVANLPVGEPLRVWRAKRESLNGTIIKTVVSQLTEALAALHAFELVHLSVHPGAIFVSGDETNPIFVLGGYQSLTNFDRKEPIAATADPCFAPPEAVGLSMHVAGKGICAWDWWALGRIVQELILGEPLNTFLVKASGQSGEARALIEALVMEADPKAPRAGAVEKMPAVDSAVRPLLRGLLTTAQDARWTGDNVDRWIRGLPVKDLYDAPRKEMHFRWQGRACTVPEVAVALQGAANWSESGTQLFEQTKAGTLAHFLRWSPTQTAALEQLVSAHELADMLPLKMSSPVAQRETVTMVALLQLSGGKLVWRGQGFEGATVTAMLTELGESDGLMVLRALTTRATALQIERVDATAGRFLTELGRTVGDVESILKRYGWLAANDTAGIARIFRLAVEAVPTLRATREELGQRFAGSDHTAMEKLFKAQNVGRVELVVLAWAAPAAEKFKFYTHAEAARRRAEALRTRGLELTGALTWAQFERALRVGRVVCGGWGAFIGTWFLLGVLATLLWPGPLGSALILAPGVVALLLRVVLASVQRRELRAILPDTTWTWRDGPDRCRRELRLAGRGVRAEVLDAERANIVKELETLTAVQPPPEPLPELPKFSRTRFAGVLSWALVMLCLGGGAWRYSVHPFSPKEFKAAWAPAKPTPKPARVVAVPVEEKPADVKVSWPFKPGEHADKLTVRATQAATSDQVAYAVKHGRELVSGYRPETITTPIILPVPAGDEIGVMIFDGKRGELMNQQVYLLEFRPMPRDWVELNDRRGVYLDR